MPIQTIWDQVDGSERRLAVRDNGYDVRCGLVIGLDDAEFAPYELLTKAVIASDQPPPDAHPDPALASAGFVLFDVIVRGITANTGRIWARYQPLEFSGSPVETLAIEGSSAEHYEQVEKNPLTGEAYTVNLPGLTLESSPGVLPDLDTADADVCLVSMGYPRNIDVLTVYGLFANVPPQLHTLGGKVNDANWPPSTPATMAIGVEARPRGHWRAGKLRWEWSRRDGRYRVAQALYSKGDQPGEDWSVYAFAVDPSNGKKLAPNATLMAALIAQRYEKGIRNNIGGVIKDGQFDVISYGSVLAPLLRNTPLGGGSPIGTLEGR